MITYNDLKEIKIVSKFGELSDEKALDKIAKEILKERLFKKETSGKDILSGVQYEQWSVVLVNKKESV